MLYFALILTFVSVFGNRFPGRWTPACCDTPLPDDNCQCDYVTCDWWGDPHTTTFDGLYHHFQGTWYGRYRYVTPCQSDFRSMPFQVITQNRPCGSWFNRRLTCTDYVEIRLYDQVSGAYRLTLRIDNNYAVTRRNEASGTTNALTPVPLGGNTYVGGVLYVVTRTGRFVEIAIFTGQLCDYRPDIIVRANRRMSRVEVDLNEYYKYQSCGICGYYSGSKCDELAVAFQRFGRDYCYQFDHSLPRNMRSYSLYNWRQLNWFGRYWRDFGRGIRRLQGEEPEDLDFLFANVEELPQSPEEDEFQFRDQDVQIAEQAEQICRNVPEFQEILNTCSTDGGDADFCADCGDEVVLRLAECQQIGLQLGVECVRLVCSARCRGDNCEDGEEIDDRLDGNNPIDAVDAIDRGGLTAKTADLTGN